MNTEPIIYWKLDGVEEGNCFQSEAKANNIKTSPQAIPDEKFGSCLQLNDNSIDIKATDRDPELETYTVALWVKPTETDKSQDGVILQVGPEFNICLGANGNIQCHFPGKMKLSAQSFFQPGLWLHVAASWDGKAARIYYNGNLEAEEFPAEIGDRSLRSDAGQDIEPDRTYKGCVAHLRLYWKALQVEEIRRDMIEDESAASAFARSHPLDFELYNRDNHHVLYIDDNPDGQSMTLDIKNTSTRDIVFKKLEKIMSATIVILSCVFARKLCHPPVFRRFK